MASPPTAASWLEMLRGVLHESTRVAASHSRHFLALSILFLLPLSFLLVALPSLPSPLPFPSPGPPVHPVPLLRLFSSSLTPSPASSPALYALAAAAALLLSLAAPASVSHGVHRGSFGRPVKLHPTLRSLPTSFARLLLTLLAAALPAAVLLTLLASLLLVSLRSPSFLNLPDARLAAFLICSYLGAVSVVTLTYLILN